MEKDKKNPGRKAKTGSAFHIFQVERNANFSQKNDSTKEAKNNAAYKEWKELSVKDPEKVVKYMKRSKDLKIKNNQSDLKNRYDQSGRSLETVMKDDQMKEEDEKEQQQFVETTVNNIHAKGILTEHTFHIIFFNTTTPSNGTQEGKHYPCEIGLVEYSIQRGLGKTFHIFVSPTQVPIGYRFEATQKSKSTHNIPPDPEDFDKYERDYKKIVRKIENFVSDINCSSAILPLYVMPNHMEAAKYIIKFICEKAGATGEKEKVFKIYQLPQLVVQLLEVAPGGMKSTAISNKAAATKLLDKEQFKYFPGLGCDFHEEVGNNTHYCALTIAKCLAFNMSQICSNPFNVFIQPGLHTPEMLDRSDALPRVSTETVKQAVLQETKNSWGTTISVHAAPAGVSSIPNSFDPNQVTLGPEAQLFPGLHPEVSEQNQSEDGSQDANSNQGYLHRPKVKDVGTKPKYYRRGFLVRPDEISQDVNSQRGSIQQPEGITVSQLPQSSNRFPLRRPKDTCQQTEYSHQSKDVNQQPKDYTHRGSPLQYEDIGQQVEISKFTQDDVGSVKYGDIFYSSSSSSNSSSFSLSNIVKVAESSLIGRSNHNSGMLKLSSPDSNDENGPNTISSGKTSNVISSNPEREKIQENGKIEEVGEAKGTDLEGRKESLKLEIVVNKQENESHERMKKNTKRVKVKEISTVQTSRPFLHREESEDSAPSTGAKNGEKAKMNLMKRDSRGNHDMVNDLEKGASKIDKKGDNSNTMKAERYFASVEDAGSCDSKKGKNVLRAGGNGVKSDEDTHSVLNDGGNSTVGKRERNVQKIVGHGRGRGNVRILGSTTTKK